MINGRLTEEELELLRAKWIGHFMSHHPAEYAVLWSEWEQRRINPQKAHERLHHDHEGDS